MQVIKGEKGGNKGKMGTVREGREEGKTAGRVARRGLLEVRAEKWGPQDPAPLAGAEERGDREQPQLSARNKGRRAVRARLPAAPRPMSGAGASPASPRPSEAPPPLRPSQSAAPAPPRPPAHCFTLANERGWRQPHPAPPAAPPRLVPANKQHKPRPAYKQPRPPARPRLWDPAQRPARRERTGGGQRAGGAAESFSARFIPRAKAARQHWEKRDENTLPNTLKIILKSDRGAGGR